MELIDHLGCMSLLFIPAASTPPKVRTLVVPSPLESNWLAAKYNHTFITLYDLIVLKGISYNVTSWLNFLFLSFMLKNSRAAKTTVSWDYVSIWALFNLLMQKSDNGFLLCFIPPIHDFFQLSVHQRPPTTACQYRWTTTPTMLRCSDFLVLHEFREAPTSGTDCTD